MIGSDEPTGAMLMRQIKKPVVISAMIAVLATSTASGATEDPPTRPPHEAHTTAGVSPTPPTSTALAELRRLSGLSLDQLADLFDVTRRTIHYWASGSVMSPRHEERLHRLLALVRKIDRGFAAANRAALLTAGPDGILPLDLLKRAEYDRVTALLGISGRRRKSPPRISPEARAARQPRPPEELVDALQDGGPPTSGPLLGMSTLQLPRSK